MQLKKWIAMLCVLCLLFSALLTGCDTLSFGGSEVSDAFSIKLKDSIPFAYVGTAYDLGDLIVAEDNVDYDFRATYVDPESGETKKLTVKKEKITPKKEVDISVTITAESSTETATLDVLIPIYTPSDVMDELLASDGAAGKADEGVVKTITHDSTYFKMDTSVSALQVCFENPEKDNDGTNLLELSHYSLMAYYSARIWPNAAVTFWAYNPMEQDVEFKLESFNEYTADSNFWDTADNTQSQIAKAGEWSLVTFSLYKMGIENVLFTDDALTHTSQLSLLARYAGEGSCTVYIDGLDIVNAELVDGLETGFVDIPAPTGDFSDLLSTCQIVNLTESASLSISQKGNDSSDSVCFGSYESVGRPTFRVNFPAETDISGFNYLKFDMFAENCYPWASVSVYYIDENGEEQHAGKGFDTYREKWRTLYLNFDYLGDIDLTRVTGFGFAINVSDHMVENAFNCVYFDNFMLYEYSNPQPVIPAPTVEDHDLISGPMCPANTIPGINGVCKLATDETGESKSNSKLVFWTNTASGYPCVDTTFLFDKEQDWSDNNILSFDSHMDGAHYLLMFTLITLDENDNIKYLKWRTDTVLTHWMTNSAPLSWFTAEDGSSPDFSRVIGMKIAVDLAVNVTSEVGHIYLDNVFVY